MTSLKKFVTTIGLIAAAPLATSAQTMDAETLYMERTCIACHGAEGRVPIMDEYPKLAGQSAQYLLAQINDIKSGARSNAHSVAMKNVMHLSSDEELVVITDWLSGLPE